MARIIEVGPRDGLQNEKAPISTELKASFVSALAKAGLMEIEATSFVSPKWVPQLGDAAELWGMLPEGPIYSALVPNMKGLERAVSVGVERIALFTAASDAFTKKNINMSIDESLGVFEEVVGAFRTSVPAGFVRGYVSTVVECPYSGPVTPSAVAQVVSRLFAIGVDEVSLGDTIGVAVPKDVASLIGSLGGFEKRKVCWHFHDTRGTAIANVACALDAGYAAFDASAGGLGGCPYAPGAGGNLATEDLVYFLERSGVATGVDLSALAQASLPVLEALGRRPGSKAQLAALSACR
ncbi:MAG TPA: hydroxymethylglutaryl-CoA lyase [Fimbriimonadaceae bacterium]|nr:hydroxymethylglutaryl-CoA lyase [Fimbriimonadaceae bacterium]